MKKQLAGEAPRLFIQWNLFEAGKRLFRLEEAATKSVKDEMLSKGEALNKGRQINAIPIPGQPEPPSIQKSSQKWRLQGIDEVALHKEGAWYGKSEGHYAELEAEIMFSQKDGPQGVELPRKKRRPERLEDPLLIIKKCAEFNGGEGKNRMQLRPRIIFHDINPKKNESWPKRGDIGT